MTYQSSLKIILKDLEYKRFIVSMLRKQKYQIYIYIWYKSILIVKTYAFSMLIMKGTTFKVNVNSDAR